MGGRPLNFIQIMFHSVLCNQRVLFPTLILRNIRRRLHKIASLETPTGLSWIAEVGAAGSGRRFFCEYGWMDFMEHHSVGHGCPLLFRLDQRSWNVECGVSEHGVPFFKKELSKSGVSGKQSVALPASFLKDNNLLLNNKYKSYIVEFPVGGRARSGLSLKYVRNGWKCSLLGGWKNFCSKCQPKKGDVVSIFLDFDEDENIPMLRILFVGRDFDFISQVKTEVLT
ncbi:hypothetical protein ACFE04_021199 [Oxalis oulophora]